MEFKAIFERHFFTNHHVEAKRLESRLEKNLAGCECVTYSSFPGLLAAISDELCEGDADLYVDWEDPSLVGLNTFFRVSGRKSVGTWNSEIQQGVSDTFKDFPYELFRYIRAALTRERMTVGLVLDFTGSSCLLESAAVFVTREAMLAEKVRWSRSSYGRRSPASVNIAANGRLSEFQGLILNSVLDKTGYDG